MAARCVGGCEKALRVDVKHAGNLPTGRLQECPERQLGKRTDAGGFERDDEQR